ncbi:hypothetical protein KNN17_21080 [Arthrobacter bambusae]|uniref:hypothetical protein n=1 Tax=Arthrobacter bambusae TaxID=1338426 RepID=UPI001F50D524|nr:hypothetical protein [Arthrobacter bambusae]MCI0144056.1 hypothetical protein [Arthrobacter bambusae]
MVVSSAASVEFAEILERVSSSSGPISPAYFTESGTDFVTTMEMLKAFGLVTENSASNGYVVASEIASVFMRSLAQYIRAGKPAFEGWSRWSSPDDQRGSNIRNGPHLTLAMEEYRAGWENPIAIRTTSVVQAVIKARFGWKIGVRFLVRWDSKANSFQLVGGHHRATDESADEAILRELEEEIPSFVSSGLDQLSRGPKSDATQVSHTFGALTQYRMQFYTITFAKGPPALAPSERWATFGELVNQRTRQGERINLLGLSRAVGNLGDYLKELPSSYQAPIRPSKRQIASQFAKFALTVLGIAGGLVALVQAWMWIWG